LSPKLPRRQNSKTGACHAEGLLDRPLNIRDPDAHGEYRKRHTVILEFESLEQTLACYHSTEYQEARVFLTKAGDVDLVIVPAYTGSQPGR
jgi:hypothetical protein